MKVSKLEVNDSDRKANIDEVLFLVNSDLCMLFEKASFLLLLGLVLLSITFALLVLSIDSRLLWSIVCSNIAMLIPSFVCIISGVGLFIERHRLCNNFVYVARCTTISIVDISGSSAKRVVCSTSDSKLVSATVGSDLLQGIDSKPGHCDLIWVKGFKPYVLKFLE